VADCRTSDLLMKKQWRMWYAIVFIRSGGTLFLTRAPRSCQLHGLPYPGSLRVSVRTLERELPQRARSTQQRRVNRP